ncbi:MAG: lamin tail domain-containing protein, partial [Candidatus Nealsonbacteria bacterium]|nr:lamin tail domain-containing protein [Candidatus Nealsonbacteria bacterium]
MSRRRIATTNTHARGLWRQRSTASRRSAARSNRLMFEPLEPRVVLNGGPVISEFMALNEGSLADEDGDYSDWIELHNPAAETLSLDGWFLTDDDTDLTQWQFPVVSLPPDGYLVVFASNNDRTDPAGELHTNFKLSGGGEYLGLVRPDGTTVEFAYSPAFPQQYDDVSYGLSPDSTARGYFLQPTPRAANDETPLGDPTWHVAISEIMYHTASENDLEEYVELVNLAEQPVSVENWRFADGIEFTFPQATIAPGEYLVVAADVPTFSAKYPGVTNVVGGWDGRLSNRGERIELLDLLGGSVDQVRYADQGVWAQREIGPEDYGHRGWVWTAEHDGGVIVGEDPLVKESRSLELINSAMSNDYGQNWTASLVAEGTPGAANSVVAVDLAPLIADVGHQPIIPRSTDPVTVTARLVDEQATGTSAAVYYRVDGDPGFTASPMVDDGSGGDVAAGDGVFTTVLPVQADGAVVEFYVEATDVALNVQSWPAAAQTSTDPLAPVYEHATNALYQVDDAFDPDAPWVPGSQPVYYLLMTEAERAELEDIGDGGNSEDDSNAQMNATFIVADGAGIEVRYNVGIRNRGHGSRSRPPNNYRVNFVHDNPLNDVTRININSKYTHSQLIGSVLHRMAGNVAPQATAVQVRVNGEDLSETGPRMYGTYVAIEVRDGDFTARYFPDDPNGNSYKCLRDAGEADLDYEGPDPDDYRESYLKETNEDYDDYSDVIHLTDVLVNAPEATYLEAVAEVVNIDQWMRYLALDALMLNMETGLNRGYGDDYALYRGNVDQRFILVPHDLDTLLNLGSTTQNVNQSIFRFTEVAGLERLLNHPDVAPLFYGAFLDLIDTFFNPEVLNPLFDQVLGGFVPETTISDLKQFVVDRTAGVLAQIPQELTVRSALPTADGYPLSAYDLAVLDGTAHSAETRSVLVGGQLAEWSPREGTWTFGQGPGSVVLLAAGSEWKYLDDGSDQGTDWFGTTFVDDAWESGSAQLGYGEGDEQTVVSYGDDPIAKHITTYFRQQFEVTDPSAFATATLGLLRDDGAVVYLNGTRLFASNMPDGPIDYLTEARGSTSGAAEDHFYEYAVDPALLLPAPALNLLAVEIHQIHSDSSDVSFDLELTGTTGGTGPVAGAPLNPGINRVVVQAFDAPGGTGNESDRSFIDVWYDDGSVEIAASIAADATWDPASGPYHVTGDLTVADGATLTILPGTTVFFDAGTRLTVNGRLDAQGSEDTRIRMTAYPGSGTWGGLFFDYSAYSDQVNQLAFVDVEYADGGSEAVETENAQLVLENVHFGHHGKMYLNLHDSSVIVRDCIFPDITDAELIHYWGFPATGYALFDGNYFGSTTGYNDIIDFTGGQRPGPIGEFTNNYFSGGSDDGLDMDAADAHIEGNVFTHFHQDDARASKSHAVSTGTEYGQVSQITVVGNLFYDVDHAVLIKDGGFGTIVNNTIVDVYKTHPDATTAAVNFYEARDGQWQGDGAYLDGNIFYNVDRLFENPDPAGHPSVVTVNNSIIYPVPLGETVPWTGTGNLNVDPQLRNTTGVTDPRIDFQLLLNSPAVGTGPNGQDMGGLVPGGATISGEPPAVTTETSATLAVGGPHVYGYKYRLNNGPWSDPRGLMNSVDAITRAGATATVTLPSHGYAAGDVVDLHGASLPEYNGTFTVTAATTDTFDVSVVGTPASPAEGAMVARRQEPIELTSLADGDYTVDVLAMNSAETWQPDSDAISSKTWTVNTALVQLQINEVLAVNTAAVEHEGTWPDMIELVNHGAATVDLAGMSITDNAAAPRRFVFPADTALAPGEYLVLYADNPALTSGIHLGFSLRGDGEGVYLYDTAAAGGTQIDAVEFGLQLPDLSTGRAGRAGKWTLTEPTLGTANVVRPTGNPATLAINEWFSEGDVRLRNDFIELFNPDPSPVALGGLFLTDNPVTQIDKHPITPLSFIAGSGYAVFAADGRPETNAGHVDFKLSLEGELIGLYDADLIEIDKVIYLPQTTDYSQGRSPDGGPRLSSFKLPTPGLPNPGAFTTTRLIQLGDEWRYDASGDDLGTAWNAPGYDDSLWDLQPAVFGLEDDAMPAPINTPLELGPITYYFRTRFTVDADPQDVTLQINTLLDDGAIIYLNGEPPKWIRMNETGVNFETRATDTVDDAYFEGPFSLPTTFLQRGENVLAVEVHQASSGSSDVVFGLTLDVSAPMGNSPMLATGLELLDGLRITEMMYNPIEND